VLAFKPEACAGFEPLENGGAGTFSIAEARLAQNMKNTNLFLAVFLKKAFIAATWP
jgi:hypothetical protein